MSRVINIDGVGKERAYLTKAIVAAIRELSKQKDLGIDARDLVAFIIFSLDHIYISIDSSVAAWEKRDYWVKADHFRYEWAWTGKTSERLRDALFSDDRGAIAHLIGEIGQKLIKVNVSEKNHLGTPWIGSWDELHKQVRKNH